MWTGWCIAPPLRLGLTLKYFQMRAFIENTIRKNVYASKVPGTLCMIVIFTTYAFNLSIIYSVKCSSCYLHVFGKSKFVMRVSYTFFVTREWAFFALREAWMRIYFFRDSWIYIFPSSGNWFSIFFLWSLNMHLLTRDLWTNDFCGNNNSLLFWRR